MFKSTVCIFLDIFPNKLVSFIATTHLVLCFESDETRAELQNIATREGKPKGIIAERILDFTKKIIRITFQVAIPPPKNI